MKKKYHFTFEGSGGDGQTWTTTGYVVCEFDQAFALAHKETFMQLTNGEAIYGKPGVGCNGPYNIKCVVIVQVIEYN